MLHFCGNFIGRIIDRICCGINVDYPTQICMYEIYNFCCEDWPYFIICPVCRKHNITAADTSIFSYTLSVGNSPFLHIFHNIIDYISTQFLHFEILPVIIMKCDLYYIFSKRKFKN